MTRDARESIAGIVASLGQLPARLGALEEGLASVRAGLTEIRALIPPPVVSVGEAARWAGVSTATIRRWAKSGQIPSTKIAGKILIDLQAVRPLDDDAVAMAASGEPTR